MKDYNKIFGCIAGGAIGDALGYAVEFQDENYIFTKYGEAGIQNYELVDHKAIVSDDTQMTLFTANALILTKNEKDYTDFIIQMHNAYKEWLSTQTGRKVKKYKNWIYEIPELHVKRAPGHTCISALMSGNMGCIDEPINNSKGCGGVMRVAPIGLYYSPELLDIRSIDRRAAQAAALTHGHPLGYLPAAGLAHIVNKVCYDSEITLREAVVDMIETVYDLFKNESPGYAADFKQLMERAAALSEEDIPDLEAIHLLGEGWVAEETLAIAIYCALRYSDDFRKAVTVSVNHQGDSDSTGAVTGNIMGAYLGAERIPENYLDSIEMLDVMKKLSEQLVQDKFLQNRKEGLKSVK